MNKEEIEKKIEVIKATKVESCPRCGRDTCSCYTSGEFFELQTKLRAAEAELKQLDNMRTLAQQLAKALVSDGADEQLHHESCEAHNDGDCTVDTCGYGPGCPFDDKCSCSTGDAKRALAAARAAGVIK